jgi:hypothetical protein
VASLLAGGGAAGSALLHGAHTLAPRRLALLHVALLALLHVLLGEAGDQLCPLQRLGLHELRAVEHEEELELGGLSECDTFWKTSTYGFLTASALLGLASAYFQTLSGCLPPPMALIALLSKLPDRGLKVSEVFQSLL